MGPGLLAKERNGSPELLAVFLLGRVSFLAPGSNSESRAAFPL